MIFVSVRVDPACITANLLQVAPPSEPPDPHSHPPELSHKLRKTAARAGSSIALRDLKDIQQQLRGNALDAIVADFSVHVARDHRCVRRSASRSQSRNVTDTIPFFAGATFNRVPVGVNAKNGGFIDLVPLVDPNKAPPPLELADQRLFRSWTATTLGES